MSNFAVGFEKAQSDYDHAEPDGCQCPENCATCDEEALYCCGRCQEDEGPDPDRIRDERIDRELDS